MFKKYISVTTAMNANIGVNSEMDGVYNTSVVFAIQMNNNLKFPSSTYSDEDIRRRTKEIESTILNIFFSNLVSMFNYYFSMQSMYYR